MLSLCLAIESSLVTSRSVNVRAFGLFLFPLVLSSSAAAQVAGVGSLTLQAAIERAMAANATIAAARLRGPINLASLAVARERLNPEGSFELEKETPKEAYGLAVPLELGGTRARDTAQARFDAGDVPRLEVMQAQLALASAENESAAAEGTASAARSTLN